MCEVEIIETAEGDLYFDIPTYILKRYGWEDGDDIEFIDNKDGSITLRKVETKPESK